MRRTRQVEAASTPGGDYELVGWEGACPGEQIHLTLVTTAVLHLARRTGGSGRPGPGGSIW